MFVSSSSYYLWELSKYPMIRKVSEESPDPTNCVYRQFTGRYTFPSPETTNSSFTKDNFRNPQLFSVTKSSFNANPSKEVNRYHEDSINRRHTNKDQSKSQLQKKRSGYLWIRKAMIAVLRKSNCFCPNCVFLGLSAPLNPVLCHSQPFVGNVRFVVWFNIGSPPGHPRLPSAHV